MEFFTFEDVLMLFMAVVNLFLWLAVASRNREITRLRRLRLDYYSDGNVVQPRRTKS